MELDLEQQLLLPYWTRSMRSFTPLGGVRGAGAGRLLQLLYWTRSTPSFAWAELKLDCCCCYAAGRGLCLPSHLQVACAELELDGCCCYHTGRGLRRPSRRQADARSWSWTAAAAATVLEEVYAPPGSVRGTILSAAATLLDEVYVFLHASRWHARSCSCSGCCCYRTGRGLRLPSRSSVLVAWSAPGTGREPHPCSIPPRCGLSVQAILGYHSMVCRIPSKTIGQALRP